jgi:hypothetical protein
VTRRTGLRALTLSVAALALVLFVASATARPNALANVGWGGFGNTPDELRHSPLTEINPGNVDQLRRVFMVDFQKIDPSVRRGEQSYPVVAGRTLYMPAAAPLGSKPPPRDAAARSRARSRRRHRREGPRALARRP